MTTVAVTVHDTVAAMIAALVAVMVHAAIVRTLVVGFSLHPVHPGLFLGSPLDALVDHPDMGRHVGLATEANTTEPENEKRYSKLFSFSIIPTLAAI